MISFNLAEWSNNGLALALFFSTSKPLLLRFLFRSLLQVGTNYGVGWVFSTRLGTSRKIRGMFSVVSHWSPTCRDSLFKIVFLLESAHCQEKRVWINALLLGGMAKKITMFTVVYNSIMSTRLKKEKLEKKLIQFFKKSFGLDYSSWKILATCTAKGHHWPIFLCEFQTEVNWKCPRTSATFDVRALDSSGFQNFFNTFFFITRKYLSVCVALATNFTLIDLILFFAQDVQIYIWAARWQFEVILLR